MELERRTRGSASGGKLNPHRGLWVHRGSITKKTQITVKRESSRTEGGTSSLLRRTIEMKTGMGKSQ